MAQRGREPTPAGVEADEAAAEFSSPACALHEVDPAFRGYLDRAQVLALLNELLEAERAGATLAAALGRGAASNRLACFLQDLRWDQSRFCAMLAGQIRRLGGAPSEATATLHARAMAAQSLAEQVAFLSLGQAQLMRRIEQSVARIEDDGLHAELTRLREAHGENVERCRKLLEGRGTASVGASGA